MAVLGAEAGMVADLFRGANHFDVSMAVGFSLMATSIGDSGLALMWPVGVESFT